jgi:hypothetical protein
MLVLARGNVTGLQLVIAKRPGRIGFMKKKPEKHKDVKRLVWASIDAGRYRETEHAVQRMKERGIDRQDILAILRDGAREPGKDEFKAEYNAWNYAFTGFTEDERRLRVSIALDSDYTIVITVIHRTRRS